MEKQKLSTQEMKNIIDSRSICISTTDYLSGDYRCFDNPDEAESYAGALGWWCCNCEEAIRQCKGKL